MRISTIIESGWLMTGFFAVSDAMSQNSVAHAAVMVGQQNPEVINASDPTWTLYLGFVATGIGILGVKIIDLLMYYKNKNKETDSGKLAQVVAERIMEQASFAAQLKIENDAIALRDATIAGLHEIIKQQMEIIATTSKKPEDLKLHDSSTPVAQIQTTTTVTQEK